MILPRPLVKHTLNKDATVKCVLRQLALGIFIFLTVAISAQPGPEDFNISGNTQWMGSECFRLTQEQNWDSGSVWYKQPVDLSSSFEMKLKIRFGCKDHDGADGVVFVFSPYSEITGYKGEGMGFAGLSPAFGIEIDTWHNDHLGDPLEDHVALLRDGFVHHFAGISEPEIIPNVEDCKLHTFQINWDEPNQQVIIRLKEKIILQQTVDLVGDVFYGEPKVYWGITAATGKFNNIHDLCFERLDFQPFDQIETLTPKMVEQFTSGESIVLPSVRYPAGQSRLQSSSFLDLNLIANLLKENPDLHIAIEGHTDNVGAESTNRQLSQDRAQSIAEYLQKLGINAERLHTFGHGSAYPIRDNDTKMGRYRNRRIAVRLFLPRV